MPAQTTESTFESHLEEILLTQSGWQRDTNAEWDKDRALFPTQVFGYLAEFQPKLWREMQKLDGSGLESLLSTTLAKELDAKGSLHVLRHGFKFYGKTFRMAMFKPAHGANYEVLEQYAKSRLTVARQVACQPGDSRTIDLLLSMNGLPVATIVLKPPPAPVRTGCTR